MAKPTEKEKPSWIFTASQSEIKEYWRALKKRLETIPADQMTEQERTQLTLAILFLQK